jgi:hypothetical protein
MVCRARLRACSGAIVGGTASREFSAISAASEAWQLAAEDAAARRRRAEHPYGPAAGLPDSKVGTFTQALYDEAKKNNWTVNSMKNDWKRIFAFE